MRPCQLEVLQQFNLNSLTIIVNKMEAMVNVVSMTLAMMFKIFIDTQNMLTKRFFKG